MTFNKIMGSDRIPISAFKKEVQNLIKTEQSKYNPNKDNDIDSTEIGELLQTYKVVDIRCLIDKDTPFGKKMYSSTPEETGIDIGIVSPTPQPDYYKNLY